MMLKEFCMIVMYCSGDSMNSPLRHDSTSEYSNMSEPGKLEIDTGTSGAKTESVKQDGDHEVCNACIISLFVQVEVINDFFALFLFVELTCGF